MRSRVTCLKWRPSMSTPVRPAVLVVEDELLLRIDAAEMIEGAGFEALQAADGHEAIEILEGRPDIKVIFTDIQIHGSMDGLKLAHAVRGLCLAMNSIAASVRLNIRGDEL